MSTPATNKIKTPHEWVEEFRHRRTTVTNNHDLDREKARQFAEIQQDALMALFRELPLPSNKPTDWDKGYDKACMHARQNMQLVLDRYIAHTKEATERNRIIASGEAAG